MRRYVLGKKTLPLYPVEAKQSTLCGGPALTKDLQADKKKCSTLVWLDRRKCLVHTNKRQFSWKKNF